LSILGLADRQPTATLHLVRTTSGSRRWKDDLVRVRIE
jgi:hypothetical protein